MTEGNTLEDGIYYKVCKKCGEKKVRGCYDRHNTYADGFCKICQQCFRVKKKKDTGKYRDIEFAKLQRNRYGYAKI